MRGDGTITAGLADETLDGMGIDHLGLDGSDRRYLEALLAKFGGGPVGVETLAATLNEERETLEDVIEPFLLYLGFLQRTARGRLGTPAAFRHMELAPPTAYEQPGLFD